MHRVSADSPWVRVGSHCLAVQESYFLGVECGKGGLDHTISLARSSLRGCYFSGCNFVNFAFHAKR